MGNEFKVANYFYFQVKGSNVNPLLLISNLPTTPYISFELFRNLTYRRTKRWKGEKKLICSSSRLNSPNQITCLLPVIFLYQIHWNLQGMRTMDKKKWHFFLECVKLMSQSNLCLMYFRVILYKQVCKCFVQQKKVLGFNRFIAICKHI